MKRLRARNRLPAIYMRHNGRCDYCGCKTIMIRTLRLPRFLPFHLVTGYKKGKILIGPIATIDHVIPLSKGGTESRENIVLACECCNKRKDAEPPKKIRKYCCKRGCPLCFPQLISMLRESLY